MSFMPIGWFVFRYLENNITRVYDLENRNNKSVLLIEDEPVLAWELELKLKRWGFNEVVTKESMADSRELLLDGTCDIIISNLKLIDGWIDYDFVQLLNQGKTHLIILTGLGNIELHQLDWSLIHPSFLFKPYTSFQLKQMLEMG